MSKECLFCGGSEAAALTNEDIIPRWLLKHLGLPPDDQLFQGVASSKTDGGKQGCQTFVFLQMVTHRNGGPSGRGSAQLVTADNYSYPRSSPNQDGFQASRFALNYRLSFVKPPE